MAQRITKRRVAIFHRWMALRAILVIGVRRRRRLAMAATTRYLGAINLRPGWGRRGAAYRCAAMTFRRTGGAVPCRCSPNTKFHFGFTVAVHVAWRIHFGRHHVAIRAQDRRMPCRSFAQVRGMRANANRRSFGNTTEALRWRVAHVVAVTGRSAAS